MKPKPIIRKVPNTLSVYSCSGAGITWHGYSPEEAYKLWETEWVRWKRGGFNSLFGQYFQAKGPTTYIREGGAK